MLPHLLLPLLLAALALPLLPVALALVAAASAGAALVRVVAGHSRPRAFPPPPPPPPLPASEAEATGALNAALAGAWPALVASLEACAPSALAAALPPLPPPLAWAVSKARIHLAGPPPRLDRLAVTSPAATSGGGAGLTADASVAWSGGLEVGLGLTAGSGRRPDLAVGASVDAASADLRAEVLSFSPGPPAPAATVRLSLPRPPDVSLAAWAGSPAAAGLLPLLDAFLEAAIRDALCGPLVAPGGAELRWPPGAGPRPAGRGVVVVDLVSAHDLPVSRRGGPIVAVISVPGGQAVGGGGSVAVVAPARRGGSADDFSSSPPAAFLIAPDAPRGVRARVALYGGTPPAALGVGEVEEQEGEEGEAGSPAPPRLVALTKAGARPPTPAATPRGRAREAGAPAILRPRLALRLLVGRPGEGLAITGPPSPARDWLGGGVLRVGLGHPPPPAPGAAAPLALASLVEVSAAGRTARLGGAPSDPPAVDLALSASALASPGAALDLAAHDWDWACAADAPLTFTGLGVGRAGPATASVPLARLTAAPGGHTAGVFRLGGAPPGTPAAVALDVRWAPFHR